MNPWKDKKKKIIFRFKPRLFNMILRLFEENAHVYKQTVYDRGVRFSELHYFIHQGYLEVRDHDRLDLTPKGASYFECLKAKFFSFGGGYMFASIVELIKWLVSR